MNAAQNKSLRRHLYEEAEHELKHTNVVETGFSGEGAA